MNVLFYTSAHGFSLTRKLSLYCTGKTGQRKTCILTYFRLLLLLLLFYLFIYLFIYLFAICYRFYTYSSVKPNEVSTVTNYVFVCFVEVISFSNLKRIMFMSNHAHLLLIQTTKEGLLIYLQTLNIQLEYYMTVF